MSRTDASLVTTAVAVVALAFITGCDATPPSSPDDPAMSVTGGVAAQSSILQGPTEVEAGESVSYSTTTGSHFLEAEPAACFFEYFDPGSGGSLGNEPLEGYWLGYSAEESDDCVSPYTARIVARQSGSIVDSASVDVTGTAGIVTY